MNANMAGLSAQPTRDDRSGAQEKAWQRVEQSVRLCKSSAEACEFSGRAIEDVRRTCLYQKKKLRLQRERLAALNHRLSAQREKWGKEEAEILLQLLGYTIHQHPIATLDGSAPAVAAPVVSPDALSAAYNVNESPGNAATGLQL